MNYDVVTKSFANYMLEKSYIELLSNSGTITVGEPVLQVNLYARYLENSDVQSFYKHSRVEEVTRVLNNYYKTYDLTSCIKILRLIKLEKLNLLLMTLICLIFLITQTFLL